MKILKIALRVFGLLVVLIVLAALAIQIRGIPSYETVDFEYSAQLTPEALVRGKKLVLTLCGGCHMNRQTVKLTGRQMADVPKEFGTIYAPNITRDPQYGIGEWTDAEIFYLLRTGIKRDGEYAPPWMAKLPKMADQVIRARPRWPRASCSIPTATIAASSGRKTI